MRRIYVRGILAGVTSKKPSDIKRLRGFKSQTGPEVFNFTSRPSFLDREAAIV